MVTAGMHCSKLISYEHVQTFYSLSAILVLVQLFFASSVGLLHEVDENAQRHRQLLVTGEPG
jgi:hypothetical protein